MTQPVICQKKPYVIRVEPGTYAWCACGRSQDQPYCDGSHKGTGLAPLVTKIDAPGEVEWCGCKVTRTPPFCDGTHKKL